MTIFLDKIKFKIPKFKNLNNDNLNKFILLIVLIMLFIYSFKNSTLYSTIIYMSNNLRDINIFQDKLTLIEAVYPTLSRNNYHVKEILKEEIKEEPVYEVIDNVNYGMIDNIDKSEYKDYILNLNYMDVNISNMPSYEAVNIGDGILIKDFSDLPNIDYKKIISKSINLTKTNDSIFIYSTHASETYENSDNFKFDYTGVYRTTDEKYNMISVGERLTYFLSENKISVIEDTGGHDYGSYTESYVSSADSIRRNIKKYGKFGIAIDVHRDAMEDLSFAPKVSIGGVDVAQCMIVIGVGYEGARNPLYEQNLNLAIKLMALSEKVYPGLFRPMIIRNSVYNQDINDMSILIEIGSTGNTLDEAYRCAKCISNLLDIMYIN